MRSRSLARVVIASLGVSVVITPGCGASPQAHRPSSAIFGAVDLSDRRTDRWSHRRNDRRDRIPQSGDTVTVDGSRVDATVLDATTISLTMPAHAAGKVDVTVIGAAQSGTSQRARRV